MAFELNRTLYPDNFGEQIRDYSFIDTLGCYSCFDLKEEFEQWFGGYEYMIFRDRMGLNHNEMMYFFYSEKSDIFIGWHWDGDGVLAVLHKGLFAINNDCKKTGNWEWR